jgi:hypothetical protein
MTFVTPDINGLFWSWGALVGLGAFHGINPGMGWLLAVALGMQEGRSRAVWRAMVPLAAGHLAAVAAVVIVAGAIGVVVPRRPLQWTVAALLIGFGALRLVRHRHPRFGGMRVGMRDLAIWSFLMATAHGAGLMVLPVVMAMEETSHCAQTAHAAATTGVAATLVHGLGYLAVTAAVAWIVYVRVGVQMLRRAWVNLDLAWAVALVVTGIVTLLV